MKKSSVLYHTGSVMVNLLQEELLVKVVLKSSFKEK